MKFTPAILAPNKSKNSGDEWLLYSLFNSPRVSHKVCIRATGALPAVQFSGLTFAQAYEILHDEFASRAGCIVREQTGNIVYIQ